jgi:hypothetical protein
MLTEARAHLGGVVERFMAAVLKTAVVNSYRGFESHPLRHFSDDRNGIATRSANHESLASGGGGGLEFSIRFVGG